MDDKEMNYQPSGEKSKGIIIFLFLFFVFFISAIVFVSYLSVSYRDQVFKQKVSLSKTDRNLDRLKKYEDDQLDTYGIIDRNQKVYRIPIDQAMSKVENRYRDRRKKRLSR